MDGVLSALADRRAKGRGPAQLLQRRPGGKGRYCKYNNIPVCTPYELRHTFVSIAKVLPAGLVKSLVGHSEDMDTFGVYGHELNGDAQQQANALNSIFSRLLAHG